MTKRLKTLSIIFGLIVTLVIALLINANSENNKYYEPAEKRSKPVMEVITLQGAQWLTQTTCKILNSNQ